MLYNQKTNTEKAKTNYETSLPNPSIETTSLSLSKNPPPSNQDLKTTEFMTSIHRPRHNSCNTNDVCMPDMNKILLKFGINSSHFRTVPLKQFEKEMLLTEISPDDIKSPTISQRIKSLTTLARYSKNLK